MTLAPSIVIPQFAHALLLAGGLLLNSITLARAELGFGRDESLKKTAYFILRDQQRDIQQVQAWLKQHPVKSK